MNPKRSIKISERLSFSFGLLFVLLLIIMPLTAGTYAYNQGISDYTEYSTDTLKHISLMLKNNYSVSSGIEEFTRYAESLRSEFELPFIGCFVTSSDNSQIKLIAQAVQPDEINEYIEPSAYYYKDVSPEITQLLYNVYENGSVVSHSDIFNGEYGEVLICYTALPDSNSEKAIICVGADISRAKQNAFSDALIISLIIAAVTAVIGSIYMNHISRRCIVRLRRLSENIGEYTRIKDPIIAEQLRQIEKGNDEIAVLSQQTAAMIAELQNHINKIMEISSELLTAHEQAEKFSKLAHIDALTGLKNKMAYYETVNRIDTQITNAAAEFAFIVIDLNFLKRINDECGHNYGDIMIKRLADLIKEFFRDYDSFRIGGDEFAVIIEGERSKKALTLVSSFRQLLTEGSSVGYKKFPSAAVGCATYRAGIDANAKEVFDRADNDMYGNKLQMKAVRKD